MNRIKMRLWLVLVLMPWLISCSQAQNRKGTEKKAKKVFSLPQIPSSLTSPEDRAAYLVANYWQNFDFSDTTLISKPEVTEQAWVDFLDVLPHVPVGKAGKALTVLMDSASVDSAMFAHFRKLAEKYLYDPNSPFRNEEYYIPVLQYIVSSGKLDEIEKVRPRYVLGMALKNRPGMVATDFVYKLGNGKTGQLKNIHSDFTLLFFNNPDCPDCKRVKEYMAASPVFGEYQHSDIPSLTVLAIYPDSDLALWKQASYPSFMINGYDAKGIISKNRMYDLKAIPTLYLLDKDKRVILKDVSIEQIEAWLREAKHPAGPSSY